MVYEKIDVSVNGSKATLQTYILENFQRIDPDRMRHLVIICPGGCYGFMSEREAEPVAIRLNAMGFHAAVLDYSVAPYRYPQALMELAMAMSFVRQNAQRWHVDKIAVMGFSAGGHLAANLGVAWSSKSISEAVHMPPEVLRPDGLVLCYPIISMGEFAHVESRENLLGLNASKDLISITSLELHVDKQTPPSFIWHTQADDQVPVENSMIFASALRKAGVPFELHVYSEGKHGLALANRESAKSGRAEDIQPECAGWIDLSGTWLAKL